MFVAFKERRIQCQCFVTIKGKGVTLFLTRGKPP